MVVALKNGGTRLPLGLRRGQSGEANARGPQKSNDPALTPPACPAGSAALPPPGTNDPLESERECQREQLGQAVVLTGRLVVVSRAEVKAFTGDAM